MKPHLAIAGTSCALVVGLLAAAPPASAESDNIDAAIAQLPGIITENMAKTGVPGLAVAVVSGDKVVYSQGFGVRSTKTNEPVSVDTVFQLASVSKPLGATAVAAAVGKKLLRWDDPIAKFLPDYELSNGYVTNRVTVADMYSHRSGLPGNVGNDLELYGFDRKTIIDRMRYEPLAPFRVSYSYSNFGLTVGGEAAATAAKTTWPKLAKKMIFKPLGMKHTTYSHKQFTQESNRAALHQQVNGKWVPSATRNATAQEPAGGASSTVLDMAAWLRMQLNNGTFDGERVVAKGPLQEARSMQIRTAPASADAASISGYALGIDTLVDPAGRVRWQHSGAFTAGAATTILMIPSLDVGIVVLTNAWPIGLPESIAASFADIVENGALTEDWLAIVGKAFAPFTTPADTINGKKQPAKPKPAEALSAYTGTYRNDYVGRAKVVRRGGRLVLQLGPKLKTEVRLRHWTGNTFYYSAIDMPKAFITGATFTVKAGKATTLALEEVGPDVGVLKRS
jgi:CubicO group peptidase (beta-lactamase class C family)